jgi:hypothetical protein
MSDVRLSGTASLSFMELFCDAVCLIKLKEVCLRVMLADSFEKLFKS